MYYYKHAKKKSYNIAKPLRKYVDLCIKTLKKECIPKFIGGRINLASVCTGVSLRNWDFSF